MVAEKRPRPRRSGIEAEEERAWVEFYQRVRSDAVLAAEVLAQLDKDAEMKRSHLALYLSCKESLRRGKAGAARNKRIGYFVRQLAYLPVAFWHGLRAIGGSSRDIAIEMLPEPSSPARPAPRAPRRAAAPGASSPFGVLPPPPPPHHPPPPCCLRPPFRVAPPRCPAPPLRVPRPGPTPRALPPHRRAFHRRRHITFLSLERIQLPWAPFPTSCVRSNTVPNAPSSRNCT